MARLQRKRLISRISSSPFTYFFLVLICGLFIYSAVGAYKKSRRALEKLNVAQAEFFRLNDQKQKLSADLENANTPFGTEKAIREKFNVIKEGEKIIVVVPEEEREEENSGVEEKGFFGFIKKIFKN
ncbi:MAG: septum formation initiator family protein [Bacteroidetes bacterium]|nr:septum formation initiator family protein [Bacteroidota bacterium]